MSSSCSSQFLTSSHNFELGIPLASLPIVTQRLNVRRSAPSHHYASQTNVSDIAVCSIAHLRNLKDREKKRCFEMSGLDNIVCGAAACINAPRLEPLSVLSCLLAISFPSPILRHKSTVSVDSLGTCDRLWLEVYSCDPSTSTVLLSKVADRMVKYLPCRDESTLALHCVTIFGAYPLLGTATGARVDPILGLTHLA